MRTQRYRVLDRAPRRNGKNERGVALITALLLLLLLTGVSLAMVLSVRSDMLINGNYRNFRGSFYAADSGLNAARAYMQNQVVAAIPATFGITTQPIPNGTDVTVQTGLNNTLGSFHNYTGQGQASASWPGKYKVTGTFALASCQVLGGGGTCSAPAGAVTGYKYIYNYTLQSVGQAQGAQATTLTDRGSVTVNATLVPVNSKTSFAAWGMFIDQWAICGGSTLVPGTISGPAFTNGAWTFGANGSYIFTDSVGSASSNAGFQFSSKCDQLNASSDKSGTQTIAPQFQAGFSTGQSKVPLPPNDYNQEQAVLDGVGITNNPVSKSDLHNSLRNINNNSYPSAGATSGVFMPYATVDGVPNTITGGGIYVEGNASVVLSTGVAGNGSKQQIYTITQGSPAVTTTVTVDPGNNQTIMKSGSTTTTLVGVPSLVDPITHASSPATMLYVDGNITSLSGPGQGLPAIQDGSAVTVTSAGSTAVTGDILYKTPPVTLTQNQIPGQPADSLIPGNDKGQALGIFTATGDIQLNNKQANGNLEIDASLATISDGGTGGLVNVGAAINTLTIVGGRIQNQIKNINATTRNVFFDRRFSQNGFAPPWFPATTVTLGALTQAHATTTVQRIQWLNQSSYF